MRRIDLLVNVCWMLAVLATSVFSQEKDFSAYIFHCDCNMVPGLLELGGLPGVAGQAAPRHLLAVNRRKDPLFSQTEIERAVTHVRTIYEAAGCPGRFEHRWGAEGHRFYKDLMWPFVLDALKCDKQSEE